MMQRNLHLFFRREWPYIVLAVRGTVAAVASLAVAVLLKLECPYWAMTALIVIQPLAAVLRFSKRCPQCLMYRSYLRECCLQGVKRVHAIFEIQGV